VSAGPAKGRRLKYWHLVWAALRRKPTRTILTLASIVTAFFLFGVLQGINAGINSGIDAIKGTHLRVSSRTGLASTLPVSHVARIAQVPGVRDVTGVTMLMGRAGARNTTVLVSACDLEATFRIYTEMAVPKEQLASALRSRTGVIVGKALAAREGWKVGDRIPLRSMNMKKADGSSNWVFDVAGLYEQDNPDQAMFILAQYDYVNEGRSTGKNTVFQVVAGIDAAARAAEVSQAIDDAFANSPNQTLTQTEKEFVESTLRRVGDINFLIDAIVGAVLFTLLFLTANTMAQSVRERIPELAVLKSMGWSDQSVQWLVLAEALALCLSGAVVGLWLSVVVLPAITYQPAMSLNAMHVPGSVFLTGAVLALIMAVASGLPLARRARRLDIAAALSGRR
jgi:putative ABC transport system permease protein